MKSFNVEQRKTYNQAKKKLATRWPAKLLVDHEEVSRHANPQLPTAPIVELEGEREKENSKYYAPVKYINLII